MGGNVLLFPCHPCLIENVYYKVQVECLSKIRLITNDNVSLSVGPFKQTGMAGGQQDVTSHFK
jgi:hypothetical protein